MKFGVVSAAMLAAALLPQAASCADLGAAQAPQQDALIAATCSRVMGLDRGEMQYDACIDSLSRSASNLSDGREASRSHDGCERSGFKDGTSDFAMCVLDARHEASSDDAADKPVRIAYDAARKSYFDMTPGERWKTEQHACAQLGLDPDGAAFSHCVASLDTNVSSPDE